MVKLGLIGWPLGHSQSPEYFAEKFRMLGIEGSYSLFPLGNIEELPALIEKHPDLRGFNVTIPYKQAIIPYLNHISAEAEAIGAVNTIAIDHKDGKAELTGHNTDCLGFADSLSPIISTNTPSFRKALILGTGGASKAVAYGLKSLGIDYMFVSRNPSEMGNEQHIIGYDDLSAEIMSSHGIIVNCTPLGMWPNAEGCPEIPWNLVPDNAVCYDLVYDPAVTEFMKRGAVRGATVKNGLEMLHRQADAAWEIWHR